MGAEREAAAAERVVVVAPFGRDSSVLCAALRRAGIGGVPCRAVDEAAAFVGGDAGALVLTEEALAPAGTSALLAALAAQPAWSDLPIVMLGCADPLGTDSGRAVEALRAGGNVTILARPVRLLSLITAVQSALRARHRQYELRAALESEQAARQRAEDALRLKDEFLATVSHELRTPLSVILLWTRLLLEGQLRGEKMTQGFQAIGQAADAQSKLVEDLLDASRMVAGKLDLELQVVDLSEVARSAVELARPAADVRRIAIETTLTPSTLVRADPGRLQQVFANLLSNAIKFTPAGGYIFVSVTADAERAAVEVRDTGEGVDAAFLPHMFERFRQADSTSQRRHGGLGLGLAITRDLVALHGGAIRASSPGKGLGTVLTVELPLADTARREQRAARPARAGVVQELAGRQGDP